MQIYMYAVWQHFSWTPLKYRLLSFRCVVQYIVTSGTMNWQCVRLCEVGHMLSRATTITVMRPRAQSKWNVIYEKEDLVNRMLLHVWMQGNVTGNVREFPGKRIWNIHCDLEIIRNNLQKTLFDNSTPKNRIMKKHPGDFTIKVQINKTRTSNIITCFDIILCYMILRHSVVQSERNDFCGESYCLWFVLSPIAPKCVAYLSVKCPLNGSCILTAARQYT
jgi:hypothetical protein